MIDLDGGDDDYEADFTDDFITESRDEPAEDGNEQGDGQVFCWPFEDDPIKFLFGWFGWWRGGIDHFFSFSKLGMCVGVIISRTRKWCIRRHRRGALP